VIIRGTYDTTIRSPRILERSDATTQISKIRESRVRFESDGGELDRCVGLDWLSVDPRSVLAAYVVDEADEAWPQSMSAETSAPPSTPSSGEPIV
jgi:hypothetical protein